MSKFDTVKFSSRRIEVIYPTYVMSIFCAQVDELLAAGVNVTIYSGQVSYVTTHSSM
jgi:hypothetical protein